MCGIAGILGRNAGDHADAVRRMTDALQHRGPDGCGIHVSPSGRCVLGHRRLAILDPSERAAQPMVDEGSGAALVYNGECYNYAELKTRLCEPGAVRSSGDTEVVFRAIAEQRRDALAQMNGMFALAWWDEAAGRLLLARDRFGQKPLYWSRVRGLLIFASELKALAASGLVAREANLSAVGAFLRHGCVPGPETILTDVYLAPAGSCAELAPGDAPEFESFLNPEDSERERDAAAFRDLIVKAAGRHLVTDRNLGVFLSGGLDSSALAIAARAAGAEPLHTLTVVYPETPERSEGEAAAELARRLGARHEEIAVDHDEILSLLPEALAAMDQPSVDGVNTYVISRAAAGAGLQSVFSGVGADELLGGYATFRNVPRAYAARRLMGPFAPAVGRYLARSGPHASRAAKLRQVCERPASLVEAYVARRGVFTEAQIELLSPELGRGAWARAEAELRKQLEERGRGRSASDAIRAWELNHYMGQTLLRDADAMSMAHSVELRLPFLDTELADAALAVDLARQREPKAVLREAFGDDFPEGHLRQSKQGFTLPFEHWLLHGLRREVEAGLGALEARGGLFRAEGLRGLIGAFERDPAGVGWSRPWALYVLSRYLESNGLALNDEIRSEAA